MLRATLVSDKEVVCLVGIVDKNIVRMNAGMPLDINIDEMTPPGRQINRIVVNLCTTYIQWIDELEQAGMEIPDHLRETAKRLDAQS